MPATKPVTHTPGPWYVGQTQNDADIVYAEGRPNEYRRIAEIDSDNYEANARLIAAAPALLAALQKIVSAEPEAEPNDEYDDMEGAFNDGYEHGVWDMAQIARAALALAEGSGAK